MLYTHLGRYMVSQHTTGHANCIIKELMLGSSRQCPQLSVVPYPILENMLTDILTKLLFTERVG